MIARPYEILSISPLLYTSLTKVPPYEISFMSYVSHSKERKGFLDQRVAR